MTPIQQRLRKAVEEQGKLSAILLRWAEEGALYVRFVSGGLQTRVSNGEVIEILKSFSLLSDALAEIERLSSAEPPTVTSASSAPPQPLRGENEIAVVEAAWAHYWEKNWGWLEGRPTTVAPTYQQLFAAGYRAALAELPQDGSTHKTNPEETGGGGE